MRAFVPEMVQQVASNAYEVKPGDDVGSIAAGFTGCPMKYNALVGANLHKQLVTVPNRRFQVFSSLQNEEHLNLPAEWVKQEHGTVGAGSVQTNQLFNGAEDQLAGVASVIQSVITAGVASNNWPDPATPDKVAMLLAQWWPYMSLPPNNIGTLPTIDIKSIYQWFGWFGQPPGDGSDPITNLSKFGQLITVAQNYWNAFQSLKYWPWDKVPWEWLTGSTGMTPNWIKLVTAFGNNPTAIKEAATLLVTIAALPAYQSAKNSEIQHNASLQLGVINDAKYGPWNPPGFITIDWSQPPYTDLITWFKEGYIDPSAIPWDLLMNTETTDCFLLHPGRLQEMAADVDCFKRACAGDPVDNFKKWICVPTYLPGWCNTPTCTECTPKTCAQLGAQCGAAPDGCGGVVNCGTCPTGKCGDGGPNKCATTVKCDPPCTKNETCVNGECKARGGFEIPTCKSEGDACNKEGECCGQMTCSSGKCSQARKKAPTVFCATEGQAPSGNASHECCAGLENVDDKCVKKAVAAAGTSALVYVGIGAGILALGGIGYALMSQKSATAASSKQNPAFPTFKRSVVAQGRYLNIQTPRGTIFKQAWASRLKPGDKVEVTFVPGGIIVRKKQSGGWIDEQNWEGTR